MHARSWQACYFVLNPWNILNQYWLELVSRSVSLIMARRLGIYCVQQGILYPASNLMGNSYCWNFTTGHQNFTYSWTCPDSIAVVLCAKFVAITLLDECKTNFQSNLNSGRNTVSEMGPFLTWYSRKQDTKDIQQGTLEYTMRCRYNTVNVLTKIARYGCTIWLIFNLSSCNYFLSMFIQHVKSSI